jgi:hypothetical protein
MRQHYQPLRFYSADGKPIRLGSVPQAEALSVTLSQDDTFRSTIVGEHGNLWNGHGIAQEQTSMSVNISQVSKLTFFGRIVQADQNSTTLTMCLSQDNIHYYNTSQRLLCMGTNDVEFSVYPVAAKWVRIHAAGGPIISITLTCSGKS